jgi:hypothetical protein
MRPGSQEHHHIVAVDRELLGERVRRVTAQLS